MTTGQPMAILGNHHLNHGPQCTLTAPIYIFQSVIQALHVQGKQVVSFSMDANNCLSFRAADTSSSSHCKHICREKIYSKVIHKSSYTIHLPPKITNNIYYRRKYRIFQFSVTYTDYRMLIILQLVCSIMFHFSSMLQSNFKNTSHSSCSEL